MRILSSEITPPQSYFDRRKFLNAAGTLALGGLLPAPAAAQALPIRKSPLSLLETSTPRDDIVNHGNFLVFASDKNGHVERPPDTVWMKAVPDEYGFYANVNPEVDHPRRSQARERRIGEFFRRATRPFNGYADQVASLYAGMDPRKFF